MFEHSIPVPRLYRAAAKITENVNKNKDSVKNLVYQTKHPNTKALYALVVETLRHDKQLEFLFKRTKLVEQESRFNPWLAKVLVTELLWGKKRLAGESKPVKTILAYQQVLNAHVSDVLENQTTIYKDIVFLLKMDKDVSIDDDNAPLLPAHTKQAAKALALLLFYSVLMFTLPFGSFYATKYILKDTFHIDGFSNTAMSVFAAVIIVNLIIFAYVYHALYETEYDDAGNEIEPNSMSKSDLNLKSD